MGWDPKHFWSDGRAWADTALAETWEAEPTEALMTTGMADRYLPIMWIHDFNPR